MPVVLSGGRILGSGAGVFSTGSTGPAPGAVQNFFIARQGDTTNGTSNGTQNSSTITMTWTAPISGAAVDHYIIQRSVDYGAFADYDTVASTVTSYTDTVATNAYNSDNIGEGASGGGTSPLGQTSIYDYNIIASADAGGVNRSPNPSDCQIVTYQGAAPTYSTSTAYRVGDRVISGGTQYYCWTANTNQAVTNTTYWIALTGGNACNGVGDLSFGLTVNYADTTGSPVGGGTDILCTNTAGNGNTAGLQFPTATPLTWNYGLEVGAFNYIQFDMKCQNSAQVMDFAIFSRGPEASGTGGDVTSHINLSNFTNSGLYGPVPIAGTWQSYKIPLSALAFSTPLAGITTFTGVIGTGGALTVSGISGQVDPCCWIANTGSRVTTGATSGVWCYLTPSSNGNGTYGITMGEPTPASSPARGTDPPTVASSAMTNRRTNFYKTAIKNQTGANWFINNVRFTRA